MWVFNIQRIQFIQNIYYTRNVKNILASNLIYVSLVHTKEYLEKYFNELDRIFNTINKFESNELNTTKLIQILRHINLKD